MVTFKTACPNCGMTFSVDEAHQGKKGRCKRCGKDFILTKQGERSSSAASVISVHCPSCQCRFNVDAIHIGRHAKCAKCGTKFQIASTAAVATPAAETQQSLPETPGSARPDASAEDNVPLEWKPGDVILDLYEVKEALGEGGMGRVYRVHHRGWNLDLAVKCPKPDKFGTDAQKETFERECETWVNLGLHPHIVSCYYVRRLGDVPRVFAEYIEGGSLKDWIEDRRLYEGGPEEALKRILDIAIQFAWGLHYAHEQGLIHQDVKPANVMMTADGMAKVTDFGFAKARAVAEEEGTSPGAEQAILVSLGGMTPAYCSPEQANKEKLSRATDIWSWAVSILEMFTGDVTWPSGTVAAAALEAHLETGSGDESLPKIPAKVAELVRRCFQTCPDDRPIDMHEIAETLKEIRHEIIQEQYPREGPKVAELLADGLNNRALSLLELNRTADAMQFWLNALSVDPQHADAAYNLAMASWRLGRIDDVEACNRLRRLGATRTKRVALRLGMLHLERCAADEAEVELTEALTDTQIAEDNSAWRALGDAYMAQCKYEKAVQAYNRALELAPDDSAVMTHLETAQASTCERNTDAIFPWIHCRNLSGRLGVAYSFKFGHAGDWWLEACTTGMRVMDARTLRVKCEHKFRYGDWLWVGKDSVEVVGLKEDGEYALLRRGIRYALYDLQCRKPVWTVEKRGVVACQVSRDFRFLVMSDFLGNNRCRIVVWDLLTGKHIREVAVMPGDVVALVPSGEMAIMSGLRVPEEREPPTLLRLADGKVVLTFEDCENLSSALVSHNGRLVFARYGNRKANTVGVWDIATGRLVRTYCGSGRPLALSSDSHWLLAGGSPPEALESYGTLRLWDTNTGRCMRTLGHADRRYANVSEAEISPDRRLCLVPNNGYTLLELGLDSIQHNSQPLVLSRVASTSQVIRNSQEFDNALRSAQGAMKQGNIRESLIFLEQARLVPGFSRDQQALRLWRELGRFLPRKCVRGIWLIHSLHGHTGSVNAVAVSPDGGLVLSGSHDRSVRLWDLQTGECVRTLTGHTEFVTSVCFSPDGQCFASASGWLDRPGELRVWDTKEAKCIGRIDLEYVESGIAISPDSRHLVVGGRNRSMRLLDLSTMTWIRTLAEYDSPACPSFTPDGRYVFASGSNAMRLCDIRTGECLQNLRGHAYTVMAIAVSPDGQWAFSASNDSTLYKWDLRTGRDLAQRQCGPSCIAIVPDGRWAIFGGGRTLELWNTTTLEPEKSFEVHTGSVGVHSVSISSDGTRLVSGGKDKTIHVWHLDWNYEQVEPSDWDEGVCPYLEVFLTLRTPYAAALSRDHQPSEEELQRALTRRGHPTWNEEDFQQLLQTLRCAGYGWLRPEAVRKMLEEMTANWQGPPPLQWKK